MQRTLTLVALATSALFTGCASIVGGTNQTMSVDTRSDTGPVVGAQCKLVNNKGTWYVTTPGSTMVNRSVEDMFITCEKPTHPQGSLAVKSTTKGLAAGNILFGGIIGVGVDIASGAAFDYPALVTVMMDGKAVLVPAQAAANDPCTSAPVTGSQWAALAQPDAPCTKAK